MGLLLVPLNFSHIMLKLSVIHSREKFHRVEGIQDVVSMGCFNQRFQRNTGNSVGSGPGGSTSLRGGELLHWL